MSTTTPTWTGTNSLIADEVVDIGETIADHSANATWDLRTKFGGWLYLAVAREDDTAIDTAIRLNVRREYNGIATVNSSFSRVGGDVTAADTTVDGDSANGQGVLQVTNTTGFAAGDFIAIGDMTDGTRLEFRRVAKVTNPGAGGELVLDDTLENTHTAVQGDVVTNQADLFQMWLPGGAQYTIQADYGEATSGPAVVVRARGQTYDSLGS